MAYYTNLQTMLEMFVDRTSGETFNNNRLQTETTDSGNVALIGYGWLKVAEYNEARNAVTVFTGHRAINSETTNKWLNQVIRVASERGRDVILSGESPTTDKPPECVKYTGNYRGDFARKPSSIEEKAVTEVNEELAAL